MPATNKLVEGYVRFREGCYLQSRELFIKLSQEGQFPKIAIISCCNSSIEPFLIFDCKPGDLFVIRNVANLVPPCESSDGFHGTSAAMELVATGLEVESIIVLGHTQYGGIKALMDNPQFSTPKSFISTWMKQLENVRNDILGDDRFTHQEQRYHACEQQSILESLRNLMSFSWIHNRVQKEKLKLHVWLYNLHSAELIALEDDTGKFHTIS